MAVIKDLKAREILDSRGNPTIEVDLILEDGLKVSASVPSGASTGSREAIELRDKDKTRYNGKGVLNAVKNVNTIIKEKMVGKTIDQIKIDRELIKMDNSPFKANLGANALLAVSLACLKAGALAHDKELYEYVTMDKVSIPIPMMNILNGGRHADNNIEIQEFMIVPVVKTFKERLRLGSEVFYSLKDILKQMNLATSVGDEGGFAPKLSNNEEALKLINKAIIAAGYVPGKDVFIALDCAASEFYDRRSDKYLIDGKELSADDLIRYYIELVEKYPIMSIEDPFYEEDFESLTILTKLIGNKIMLVGDDFFVTNKKYLQKGIENKAGNAILLKANQIGTITEMIETIMLAKKNDFKMVISHRSGETEDTFIADLAVGLNIPFIKTGSLSRGERIAKYNRLLRIEEQLTSK